MEKLFSLIITMIVCLSIQAQLNMELISQVEFESNGNDIWGYVAPDGTEYALMGLGNGVSIQSLADPANPEEVAFIEGDQSVWRDLKTWKNYAYVTTDESGTKDGLLIINLSNLPTDVSFLNWTPTETDLTGESSTDTLHTFHNLYIDEFGFCYLSGGNLNDGGIVVVDVDTPNGIPNFVTYLPDTYSHDVYVRNNLLYSSDILEGEFTIYDVTDKNNIQLLASQASPFNFCHNTWLSDDGNTLFTTDELRNAPTGAYDISNLDDIKKIDEFRPAETLNQSVVPHNVHVLDDYLVISHYSDGCIIVDASKPDNLVEVGNYDTYTGQETGLNGAWGAYPFLPSGLILVSDIDNGLFVFQPTYVRAAFLEGQITNEANGAGIQNAKIIIESNAPNTEFSNLAGNYKTGQVSPGTFLVHFSALGFFDKTVETTIQNGNITILDVALTPLPKTGFNAKVIDAASGDPIKDAQFFLERGAARFAASTNENGKIFIEDVFVDDYELSIGHWGYLYHTDANYEVMNDSEVLFELSFGYEDNFNLDLDWTIVGTVERGPWARQIPAKATWEGNISSPEFDTEDFGIRAMLTGNSDPVGRSSDVDGGVAIIQSPIMDLTQYNRPILNYDFWFFNYQLGEHPVNDSFYVKINNGTNEVFLDITTASMSEWRTAPAIDLANFISITENMTVTFHVSDIFFTDELGPDELRDDVSDGGLDNFRITEGLPNSVFDVVDENIKLKVFPNPASTEIIIDYKTNFPVNHLSITIFNVLGQAVKNYSLENRLGQLNINNELVSGTYFVVLNADGLVSDATKIVVQ